MGSSAAFTTKPPGKIEYTSAINNIEYISTFKRFIYFILTASFHLQLNTLLKVSHHHNNLIIKSTPSGKSRDK
jgi:hypothetical protein